MIIKKLETFIILKKAVFGEDIKQAIKDELKLKRGFEYSRIVEINILDNNDLRLGNSDYILQYKDYIAVEVKVFTII